MRRPWIKIETTTPDKPEICAIATQLRMDADMVVGKLIRIWSWITVNRVSGSDLGVTKEFLDKLVGRKSFADALESAGWLLVTNGKLSMPHFERHNSDAAKVRALTAQRVKRHRIAKEIKDEVEELGSEASVTKSKKRQASPKVSQRNDVTVQIPEAPPTEAQAADDPVAEAPPAEVPAAEAPPAEDSPSEAPINEVPELVSPPELETSLPEPISVEDFEAGENETGETLSINAEPTFRPLDFEDPPIREDDLEAHVFEDPFADEAPTEEPVAQTPEPIAVPPELPKQDAEPLTPEKPTPEPPAPEPAPAKKSKRKADAKQDDQPLLF
jgi:hypothetical protein